MSAAQIEEIERLVRDHAACRWIERVYGIEIPNCQDMGRAYERKVLEEICARHKTTPAKIKIALCPPMAMAALKAKARRYYHPNGMGVVFRNGVVVTVLSAAQVRVDGKPKKARRRPKGWSRR